MSTTTKEERGKFITGSNPNNKYKFKGQADYISTAKLADSISEVMVGAGADPEVKIPIRLCIRRNANACFGQLSPEGRVSVYTGAINALGDEIENEVPEVQDRIDAVLFTTLYTAALVESLKPGALVPGLVKTQKNTPEFKFAQRRLEDAREAYEDSPAFEGTGDKNSVFTLMQNAKKKANIFGDSDTESKPAKRVNEPVKAEAPKAEIAVESEVLESEPKPEQTSIITPSEDKMELMQSDYTPPARELDLFGEDSDEDDVSDEARETETASIVEKPEQDTREELDFFGDGSDEDDGEETEIILSPEYMTDDEDEKESSKEDIKAALKRNIRPKPKAKADEYVDTNALMVNAQRVTEYAPKHVLSEGFAKTTAKASKHDTAAEIVTALEAIC